MISTFDLSKLRKFNIDLIAALTCTLILTSCSYTDSAPESISESPVSEETVDSNGLDNPSEPVVRFGVLAKNGALAVHDRYAPLLDYLSEVTGRPFELIALSQDNQFTHVADGELDFIASNPLASVQIQRLYRTEFLVTLERPNTGSQFSGLIITRSDSEIQTLSDLKGKSVACVNFETAAGGCLFQIYHLLQNDIDSFKDFASFVENPSQDNIILAVLNRTIDAGFIRTGELEKMMRDNLIENTDEIRILDPRQDDFFFTHTTDLYPEWPVASLISTDTELVKAVKEALLNIPSDHPALETANLSSFVPSESYESIHSMIEALQLKSWDAQ